MTVRLFWFCLFVVAYTYAGYPLLAALLARGRRRPPLPAAPTPAVTVVVAAYNEATRIGARVRNLLEQDYPADRLQVLVVSDGSSDGTAEAADVGDPRVRVIALPRNQGKAAAINAALAHVDTDIVVFADARQRFDAQAVRRLLAPLADPGVGAVSGELIIAEDSSEGPLPAPIGLYWRIERALRDHEAQLGWLHGVSGAVYALRRERFVALPPDLLLDDMWTPLHVVFAGSRVAVARDAIAYDRGSKDMTEEFYRKLRTLAGNWQLMAKLPQLISLGNPVLFAWVSHKLLRLLAPFALIGLFFSSLLASLHGYGALYTLILLGQLAGYAGAAIALKSPATARHFPLLPAAGTFVMLNAAALLALPAYLRSADGRGLWSKH